MKVLIFSAFDPIPSDDVEPVRYALIAEEFLRNGHEVIYVTSEFFHLKKTIRHQKHWDKSSTPQGLKLHFLPAISYKNHTGIKRSISYWYMALQLRKFLDALPKHEFPGLIISATPPLLPNSVITKWAERNNIPLILDIQDLWPEAFERFIGFKFLGRLLLYPLYRIAKMNAKRAKAVSAVSKDYLEYYKNIIRDKPAQAFYLGTRTAAFSINNIETSDKKRLVYIGAAHTNNGLFRFIDIIGGNSNYELDIIGAGDSTSDIEKYINGNNIKNIHCIAWMDFNALANILPAYQAGLLLVDEGSYIAFPNKAFSYFAAGLPVVSNIRGGELEELIKHNNLGITIQTNSEDAFNTAIENCCNYTTDDRVKIREYAVANLDNKDIYRHYYEWLRIFIT